MNSETDRSPPPSRLGELLDKTHDRLTAADGYPLSPSDRDLLEGFLLEIARIVQAFETIAAARSRASLFRAHHPQWFGGASDALSSALGRISLDASDDLAALLDDEGPSLCGSAVAVSRLLRRLGTEQAKDIVAELRKTYPEWFEGAP